MMQNILNKLRSEDRWGSIYILARYLYRVGEEPLISDAMYDSLTKVFKEKYYNEFREYLERTYDDDPIPYNLLEEFNIEPVTFVTKEGRKELFAQLDEEKSLSINSVVSYEEIFPFFKQFKGLGKNLVMSLKMDGINTKMLYVDNEFKIAVSRARDGIGFDFTDQLVNVIPVNADINLHEVKITSESYVAKEGIKILRDKYNAGKYKTSKSSAISMLRVRHDKEDYKYLHTKVFAAEGLADTLSETYCTLDTLGFEVVPWLSVKSDEIPSDFDEFKSWLKSKLDILYEKQCETGLPADGVVIAVDDLLWNDTITNQYSNKQIACKFEYWKFDVYQAVVKRIITEQRRVNVSVRVEIEPISTSDDCEARIINSFNPAILIQNDIREGSIVYFERNSGAVNILIHGKRMEDILKE